MGGAMGWAAAMRVVSGLRTSIDLVTARLAAAARNDLTSPVPKDVRRDLPHLAGAMENLFGQFRSNLKHAQTLALYDPVTSLPNRTSFCRQVYRLLAAWPAGGPAARFFIDLDGVKMDIAHLAHAAGDLLHACLARTVPGVAIDHNGRGS